MKKKKRVCPNQRVMLAINIKVHCQIYLYSTLTLQMCYLHRITISMFVT